MTPNDINSVSRVEKTQPLKLPTAMTAAPPKTPAKPDTFMPSPSIMSSEATQPENVLQKFKFERVTQAPKQTQPFKSYASIMDDENNQITAPYSGKPKIKGVPDDFDDIYRQWSTNRAPDTNTQILDAVQPVIDTAIQSYVGQNANQSIKTQAKLLALQALDSYDPRRGNIRTHLLTQLQRLRRIAAEQQNIIDIPEQVGLDHNTITEAKNELFDRLGREPTDDELADHTGLSKKRIGKLRQFNQPVAEGMTYNENAGDDDYGGDVASNIPGSDPGFGAWLDFVYDDLSPIDKLIMDMSLGRNGRKKMSTQEVARTLNISPSAVSQRASKIQTLLDKRHEYDVM